MIQLNKYVALALLALGMSACKKQEVVTEAPAAPAVTEAAAPVEVSTAAVAAPAAPAVETKK